MPWEVAFLLDGVDTVRVGPMAGAVKPRHVVGPTSLYAVEPPAADAVPDVVPHLEGRDRVGRWVELTRLDQGGHRQRVPPSGRGILQPLYKSQSRCNGSAARTSPRFVRALPEPGDVDPPAVTRAGPVRPLGDYQGGAAREKLFLGGPRRCHRRRVGRQGRLTEVSDVDPRQRHRRRLQRLQPGVDVGRLDIAGPRGRQRCVHRVRGRDERMQLVDRPVGTTQRPRDRDAIRALDDDLWHVPSVALLVTPATTLTRWRSPAGRSGLVLRTSRTKRLLTVSAGSY